MPVFFVSAEQLGPGGLVRILDRDARHISRVLRSQRGELLTVVVEDGTEHDVRIESLGPSQVTGRIVASRQTRREPRARLHLVQCLPKGQGMASVCEQAAELGVSSIWPALSERTVPRPEADASAARHQRWQAIAREAAQLAGRHRVPEVAPLLPLEEAVARLSAAESELQVMVCHDGEQRQGLSSAAWDPARPTALLVGPEGGLSVGELQGLARMGARPVSLGPRNLRATLAGAVALSVLLARSGDLEAPGG